MPSVTPETLPPRKVLGALDFYKLMEDMIGENKRRVSDWKPPGVAGQQNRPEMEVQMEKRVQRLFESCLFKTTMSCTMGFALGGAFGLFTAGIDPNITGTETPTLKNTWREMKV